LTEIYNDTWRFLRVNTYVTETANSRDRIDRATIPGSQRLSAADGGKYDKAGASILCTATRGCVLWCTSNPSAQPHLQWSWASAGGCAFDGRDRM